MSPTMKKRAITAIALVLADCSALAFMSRAEWLQDNLFLLIALGAEHSLLQARH